ncbi:MAG: DUF1592 domain-containing protein [Myxococcota bacterium]
MKQRILALTLAMGCTGVIGEGTEDPLNEPPIDPMIEPELRCEEGGRRLVRRLTSSQYRQSLLAIFDGDPNVPDADVLTDPARRGFRVDAQEAVVRDLGAQQLMNHAERVAAWAVETRLDRLSSCQNASDASCRRAFIEEFGERIYRRPLEEDAVRAYDALFQAELTFADGVEAVLATLLQSPHFLYRSEIGEERGGRFELDGYELATNLAYTLTDGPPDAQLLEVAAAGRLASPEDLSREFDRLVETPAAQHNLAHFAEAWLEVEDLPGRAKDESEIAFGAEIREDMLEETRRLYLDVFASGGGLSELFGADHTFVNDRLRQHYGMGGSSGEELTRTELPADRPRGVLGHGSLLSRHALAFSSSPVMRGFFVRERLFCEELPSPPAGVDTNIIPIEGSMLTTRERYREHSVNNACNGCHSLMDPIGFAFEHYDAFGRRREHEHGTPIDATGSILREGEEDIPLDGVDSLSAFLAESDKVRHCYADYVAYYAYGVEGCGAAEIEEAALEAGGGLRDVLRATVLAEYFRSRSE